jgi:hypothetical protein
MSQTGAAPEIFLGEELEAVEGVGEPEEIA